MAVKAGTDMIGQGNYLGGAGRTARETYRHSNNIFEKIVVKMEGAVDGQLDDVYTKIAEKYGDTAVEILIENELPVEKFENIHNL